MSLTFDRLREVNTARSKRWHKGGTPWTGADWGVAMGGECGEAQNVIKKIRRHETGILGGPRMDPVPIEGSYDTLITMLAAELADTLLYVDLVADHYGIDLSAAVTDKFNLVSEEKGFPERL